MGAQRAMDNTAASSLASLGSDDPRCGTRRLQRCERGRSLIPNIPDIGSFSCSIPGTSVNPCRSVRDKLNDDLVDPINEHVVTAMNTALGEIQRSVCEVRNGVTVVENFWDCLRDELENLVDTIRFLERLAQTDLLTWLQNWIQSILGVSLDVALYIAIGLAIFMVLSWLGGFIALLRLFIFF